jgi:lysozyme family protein
MTRRIDDIIEDVISAEGGYTNNPDDPGGETKYGITIAVARANGYNGLMQHMPVQTAREIYYREYVIKPGFDRVLGLSPAIAAELVDTGVNCGTSTAGKILQRCLNSMNQKGTIWPDLTEDGSIGEKTINALAAYLKHRQADQGEKTLMVALNCLQGARYIEIARENPKLESFVFGWMRNRVAI